MVLVFRGPVCAPLAGLGLRALHLSSAQETVPTPDSALVEFATATFAEEVLTAPSLSAAARCANMEAVGVPTAHGHVSAKATRGVVPTALNDVLHARMIALTMEPVVKDCVRVILASWVTTAESWTALSFGARSIRTAEMARPAIPDSVEMLKRSLKVRFLRR